jgi:hypothetical protein
VRWVLAALSCKGGFVIIEGEHELTRSRLASPVVAGILALALAVVPSTTADAAASSAKADWSCLVKGADVLTTRWTGGDGSWSDAAWSSPSPPGADPVPTAHVCIKGAVTVTIGADSGQVNLASLVLAEGATVRVTAGAELFVWSDDTADFSLVRADSAIRVSGGTLGGPGKLLVRGLVTLEPEGGQPATLGTSDGSDVPRSGGQLVLDDQGRLRVDPSSDPSSTSRITTAYRVEARGTVTITDEALLAADHGTSFALVDQLRRTGAGTLELEDNSGYAEGDDLDGDLPLSTFTNQGVITKTGLGVSRIAADYSASGGSSTEVDKGSLLLPEGTLAAALVSPGATYGTGVCDESLTDCGQGTSTERPQLAWLTIPAEEDGGAEVAVTLEDDDQSVGDVIKVDTKSMDVTKAAPAVLQLRYDNALLVKKDGSLRTWRELDVMHQPSDGSYHTLVSCTKARGIPRGEVACVDRRGKPESSRQVEGGVIMVVLTTETSRWRVP